MSEMRREPRYTGSHGSLCSHTLHRAHPDRYADQCDCGIEAWGSRLQAEAMPSVERLARALHDTGIGCPVRKNWREIDHDALWHYLHAADILDALRGKPEDER